MIRFEILLPLFYNDGHPIEKDKFATTDEELVQQFGATSTDTIVVSGRWMYKSTVYHDKLIWVRIDTEDTPENTQAMRELKESLKTRFNQLDIWISSQRIDIL